MVVPASLVDEFAQGEERSTMKECPYCSDEITKIYHNGKCPKVKSIEYYETGEIKRVEFNEWNHGYPTWPDATSADYKYTVRWLTF